MIDGGTVKQIEKLIDEIDKIKIHAIELRNRIWYLNKIEDDKNDK